MSRLSEIKDISHKENMKFESMRAIINKAVSKDCHINGRRHTPVYGWIQMNYPSTIQPSLLTKYNNKLAEIDKKRENEEKRSILPMIGLISPERKIKNNLSKVDSGLIIESKFRKDPYQVNIEIVEESK